MTSSSTSSGCCRCSSPPAASPMPRRPDTRPMTSSRPPSPARKSVAVPRLSRPATATPSSSPPRGRPYCSRSGPARRRASAPPRCRRATVLTRCRCRTSSRCAGMPPTASRAPSASDPRAQPASCASTARWRRPSRQGTSRRRPKSSGSTARSPRWTRPRRRRRCGTRSRPGKGGGARPRLAAQEAFRAPRGLGGGATVIREAVQAFQTAQHARPLGTAPRQADAECTRAAAVLWMSIEETIGGRRLTANSEPSSGTLFVSGNPGPRAKTAQERCTRDRGTARRSRVLRASHWLPASSSARYWTSPPA